MEKNNDELRCPECRAALKQRRTRKPDACEMICGACGRMFDICDSGTLEEIQKEGKDTAAS
jgi:hypothetical protein